MIWNIPPFVTMALLSMADRIMESEPNQILEEYGEQYLQRWILEKHQMTGSVYVHRILRSDYDEELHDHPGDNLSIVLLGEMIEITEKGSRRLSPGTAVLRRSDERHRLELEEPVVTMWIMGERVREWGFWDKDNNFTPSQEFFHKRSRPLS